MKKLAFACIVLAACAGVLGLSRSSPKAFPHRAHTVAGVSCTKCHANVENEAALHIPTEASCLECHAKPHDSGPCFKCHTGPEAIGQLVEARDHLRFDHGRHIAPAKGNCARCHVGIAEGDDHLRPPMATCFKCHDHDAQKDARQCDACHRRLEDATMLPQTHLAHEGDWMREHGTRAAASADACQSCHRESFCTQCHGQNVPALPATARFADPFAPSVHRAGFIARHSLEARADPGACSTCHSQDRCAQCHSARGVAPTGGQRSPHPPGWLGLTSAENEHGREARRDPAACASCHDGAGQKLCVGCHAVGGIGGNPHPPGFSSRQPMSALPCRLCHSLGSRP